MTLSIRSVTVVAAVALAFLPAAASGAAPGPLAGGFPPGSVDADLPSAVGWGNPHHEEGGAIGDGSTAQRLTPVLIVGGSLLDGKEISDVSIGRYTGCALAVGRVYCWGSNEHGQLGNGSNITSSNSAVAVGGPLVGKQVTAISVGEGHVCALADHHAYCWGDNGLDELGQGNNGPQSSNIPVAVDVAGRKVSAITVGAAHSCALAEGDVYCWGYNGAYQLGDGSSQGRPVPTPILHGVWDAQPVDSISAGTYSTCAISAGLGYCWGSNQFTQLGVGSNDIEVKQPTAISTKGSLKGLTVKAISSGLATTCLIAGKGSIRAAYCSGLAGEVGSYPLTNRNKFSDVDASGVLAGKSVSTVAAGWNSACVVADGQGHCWGEGAEGELGDGQTTSSVTPTTVNTNGIAKKRLLSITTSTSYSAGIAARPRKFDDVPTSNVFYDDITWAAGAGVTQGNADNTYHPTENVDRQAMAAFLFRAVNPGVPDAECAAGQRVYLDVKITDAFCGPIEWLAKSGVFGVLTPKFSPGAPATRAIVADWIFRGHHPGAADQKCSGGTRLFTDVKAGDSGCGNVEWLARTGITNGFADGTFHPGDPVHRDAMAAFFHRRSALAYSH